MGALQNRMNTQRTKHRNTHAYTHTQRDYNVQHFPVNRYSYAFTWVFTCIFMGKCKCLWPWVWPFELCKLIDEN